MSGPLIVFLSLIVGMLGAAAYFLRGTLSKLSLTAAEHAQVFALAYVKLGALVTLAMLTSFNETFRDLSPEMASTYAWWNWAIAFSKPIIGGIAVVIAFLDQSGSRARDKADVIRTAKANGTTTPPFSPTTPSP